MIEDSDANRSWSKVDIRGADECWEWQASLANGGYGHFSIGGRSGSMRTAHRVAYEIRHGYCPSYLLHSCDNRRCCNPVHLRPGDHSANMREMAEREISRTTKLTAVDVLAIRAASSAGQSQRSIARKYDISQGNVNFIVARKTWRHVV